jgi:hypothetical protein
VVGLMSMERCLKCLVEGRVGCEIQCASDSGYETTYVMFGARYTIRWEGEPPDTRAPVRLPFGHASYRIWRQSVLIRKSLVRNPVRLFGQSQHVSLHWLNRTGKCRSPIRERQNDPVKLSRHR